MSTALDAIREMALFQQAQRTRIPLSLEQLLRTAAGALGEVEVDLPDEAGISTMTETETDIMIHVTGYQSVRHIDREAGPLLDVKSGTSGKSETSTEEIAMTEGFPESTTLTLARQVLRSPDCEHSTPTVDQVPPILDISQAHPRAPRHIPLTMRLRLID